MDGPRMAIDLWHDFAYPDVQFILTLHLPLGSPFCHIEIGNAKGYHTAVIQDVILFRVYWVDIPTYIRLISYLYLDDNLDNYVLFL